MKINWLKILTGVGMLCNVAGSLIASHVQKKQLKADVTKIATEVFNDMSKNQKD